MKNILQIRSLSLIISTALLLSACGKVGDLVSSTGELVSKTGKMIGTDKEAPKPVELPKLPEAPKFPQVIKIKEVKAATAKVQVNTSKQLAQSRISITVIQLKSTGKFMSSRLSDLVADSESVLGNDFISKQTISLKRSEAKTLNLEIDSSTKALGAFASYQELNQTIWRTGVQLPKATDTSYNIQINVGEKIISAVKK